MSNEEQDRATWAEHVEFIPLGADCIVVAVNGIPTAEVDIDVYLVEGKTPTVRPYKYVEGHGQPPEMTPQEVIDTFVDGDETELINIAGRAYAALVSGV